jgi:hypothetical protein
LRAASRLLAVSMLICSWASVAGAAPRSGHRAAAALCTSQLTLRKVLHRGRAAGGPLVLLRRSAAFRTHFVLTHTTMRIERRLSQRWDDGDDAIQNASPVAHIDTGDACEAALRPLGVLTHARDRLPQSTLLPRRSPRGPPTLA